MYTLYADTSVFVHAYRCMYASMNWSLHPFAVWSAGRRRHASYSQAAQRFSYEPWSKPLLRGLQRGPSGILFEGPHGILLKGLLGST